MTTSCRPSTTAGCRPTATVSTLQEGIEATLRLVADPTLDGVTGRYYNQQAEARAHPQAYDPAARTRLRELSENLTGLSR
ncbi:MAG TPA: hypothetical protein VGO16_02330 [Pseudonocardiaceae bacterium]|nr:hypothetical protein [Pseudonocardiaceae bacterium]